MRHVNKFVAATLGAMALAGCGGSSGTSSSANANAPSSAQFVSQVNKICSDVNAKVGALPTIQTQADLLTTGPKELSMSAAALAELKALTPPASKQAAVTQYISGIDQESAISTQVLAAVKAGNSAQTKALSDKGSALNSTDDARAKALGFAQCARNAQPAG
jgi:hypothetical protein